MEGDKFKDKDNQPRGNGESQENSCMSVASIPSGQKEIESIADSTSSIKSKKSSNLLSALVRRTKRKKNKTSDTTIKTINVSSQNLQFIASNSSLGMHTEEEVELKVENYEKKTDSHENCENKFLSINKNEKLVNTSDSEHSIPSSMKVRSQFFRKFMKKQPSEEGKKKSEHILNVQTSKPDLSESNRNCKICQVKDSESCKEINQPIKANAQNISIVPTSYINFGKSTLNVTLANGLQAVQELASHFQDSEHHLIQIFIKYVKDQNFQKELVETLSQHSKLQWEAERRTSALANDMWMHQIEIGRAQERTLQETLNSLVKQNRQFQIDNEIMFRKHERLVRKLRSFPEMSLKYKCMDCDSQIDHVLKHNEKLQYKLEEFFQKIEYLENDLHILQKQNDGFEQQLRHSSSQVHNLKAIAQRSKTDFELELMTLNNNLHSKEQIIKDAVEAGDVLLEDLDSLKRQFKSLPIAINWSKFKCRGSCLTDLIHLSRSCINEISKEIISMQTQITLKEKDIENLQQTNTKLQENLKKSTTELDNLSKKIDENNFYETDKLMSEQKCKVLEADLQSMKEKMERIKLKNDMEKKSFLNTISEYENLNNEILEKDRMIEQTKMFVGNITSENMALRNQIDGLNRILSESGAGDVVKELATCQEQLAYFQSQYYLFLNEKQRLMDELDLLKNENKTIIEHQETNYKHLQKQLQELEKTTKENNILRQQIDSEHQTVMSLQSERMKYLEEKNMLKTIFQHMKSEISRVQKLEMAVTDISKEASKLAMIAEYNKQLGEKLKTEVVEKDHTILQLRNSVEKLNDIQIQNTKEKLSLCFELSEVCQMKDQLNSILNMEMQKNIALDDSKKEIVESASNQIKKFEEVQKNERSALRDLLRDFKLTTNQKDNLLRENEKLQQELTELKAAHKEHLKTLNDFVLSKNEKELKIAELNAKRDEDKMNFSKFRETLTEEMSKYNDNIRQLERLIRQLRKEKEEMENSLGYLKNNVQKLHNDLNDSRKNEKETKDLLNKSLIEKQNIEKEKEQLQKNIISLNEDKDKLMNDINYLNTLCEKVLTDFESSIKASVEKEEMFKKEINESKSLLHNSSKEIEHLTETLFAKQGEIQKLTEECNDIVQKEKLYKDTIKSLEDQKIEFLETRTKKENLEDELSSLQTEYNICKMQLEEITTELESSKQQFQLVIDQKDEEYVFYKSHLDELLRKNDELNHSFKTELGLLKINLNDTTQKLENERSAYENLSQIHKEVSSKFLKSIKEVVDEKNAKQEIANKLRETVKELEILKTEKADLQEQVNILLDGLNDEKNRINSLTQEKDCNQKSLEDLQKRYSEILTKCLLLENQIRGAELKNVNESDFGVQGQIDIFKKESKENHEVISTLRDEITQLQQQITGLEFQKSEITLRLHETQRKFETERGLCEQLKNTHKLVLAAVLKMKDDGKVDPSDCNHLLYMVRSNSGVNKNVPQETAANSVA